LSEWERIEEKRGRRGKVRKIGGCHIERGEHGLHFFLARHEEGTRFWGGDTKEGKECCTILTPRNGILNSGKGKETHTFRKINGKTKKGRQSCKD